MSELKKQVTVFEFDHLGFGEKAQASPRIKAISEKAYGYLKRICLCDETESRFLRLKQLGGCEVLQVQNYAGVIFTPDQTQIEILPKVGKQDKDNQESQKQARNSLLMMLKTLKGFRHIETHQASIASQKMPLLEVFITQFLQSVNTLVKRGLRSDYVAQQDNLTFLKGKLNVGKQLRHNFINKHKFQVEYDAFLQDRPANRLMHSALVAINSYTRSVKNQKLLRELLFVFSDIPQSCDYKVDFTRLKIDRGMNYYQRPLDWSRLILDGFSPQSMQGKNHAPSLLFPMEAVFESYVAKILRRQVAEGCHLKEQVQSKKLVRHNEHQWFRLKPDLVIEHQGEIKVVLDTKWKVLDQNKNNGTDKYGLSQADFYQMFAYGQKYLHGKGDMFLLYPQSMFFSNAIASSFNFNIEVEDKDALKLWVVPVNLSVDINIKDDERIHWPHQYLQSMPEVINA
ncbi:MAG: 5-methylcytosine-specific restriction enzyme subunit McrC [Alteromonadaceae bacterium]|jgi:5-methylcytosine-specific restriction enzyme subunit McrC